MAIIAARKPYYISHFGQALDVDLYIYDFDATPPTIGVDTPNYTLRKVSFADGVDETLRLDISPYIRDYFDHSLATADFTIPDAGQQMPINMYLKVDAVVNTVTENHTALDGWLEMGVSTTEGISNYYRNISTAPTPLTFRKGSFTTVRYTGFDGTTVSYTLAATTNGYLVIQPADPSGEVGKPFTMELIGSKTATYYFNNTCQFEDKYSFSVGFVNKWGLVEWVEMVGRSDRTLQVNSSNYLQASDYTKKIYNKDGNYMLKLNTGWLQGNQAEMIEGLMMSEHVWINIAAAGSAAYYEDQVVDAEVVNTSMQIKDGRADKLVNYSIDFKLTPSILYG